MRASLTGRAVLVTCLVALVSVLITALVALPLTVRRANSDTQRALSEKARVAAAAIAGRTELRAEQRARNVAAALRAQNLEVVLIRDGQPDRAGLPQRVVNQVRNGTPVSQRIRYQGRLVYAEGRPAGSGDGIVLMAPVVTANARTLVDRLWLALGAGLLAGVAAGVLLARRLARPLRGVAAAARRLSAGERAIRAPLDGPAEVVDLSHALNDLAAALTTSEGRQRAFLMSISHELRTPLTTIRGYAEALADGVVGPDGAQRAGQTMLAEAEHLDRLVNDLLVLARLEGEDFPLEPMPVDLVALVRAAADAWAARCAAVGVILRTELPDRSVVIHTDAGRLRQVLDGLLENALRVVPPGAPVVLAVRQPALLEMRDGGPGLTDADLAVAFEQGALYERYKGVRKVGTGLGLALAARLVRRLGGRIEAGHAPEGGARFTVLLPP